MTKYNNYIGAGTGDGVNKIAILEAGATESDPVSGNTVMKEVLVIVGPTPAPGGSGVYEWCINSAALDPFTHSVLAPSDGHLYRWDLHSNSFAESIALSCGIPQASTPTVVGPDGQIYVISFATLYAVGQ